MSSIKFEKLKKVLDEYVKPRWEGEIGDYPLRYGGGEPYVQDDVLNKAAPFILKEKLLKESRQNLINCLQKHKNLLSVYPGMQAKDFINFIPEDQLKENFINLLYGSADFFSRLKSFHEWCKLRPTDTEEKKKIGINPTVISYFLAISNPRIHAFCKPSLYSASVKELIGETSVVSSSKPLERIAHCSEFYIEILNFLEENYGLENGNLFDVHSLFYSMMKGFGGSEESVWVRLNGGSKNSWIFQANPKYYDLEGALKELTNFAWSVKRYKDRITIGDRVYLWQSGSNAGILAVGNVETNPAPISEMQGEDKYTKKPEAFNKDDLRVSVKINKVLTKPILRNELLNNPKTSDLSILRQPVGTNFPVTQEQDSKLMELIGKEEDTQNMPIWKEFKEILAINNFENTFEIKSLHFENRNQIENKIKLAIKNGKHIILIGPPGTGKSKLAKEICEFYCGKNNYLMSTATSDWSTFETIGGYRPDSDGKLYFNPGIFLKCFQDKKGIPQNFWLIIDEINRADIDKAFGSLFSALTGDNVSLPFDIDGDLLELIGNPLDNTKITKSKFIIHPDWRIIATMNTFDKTSLYEMSYAFMRRFAFIPIDVPLKINSELIKAYIDNWGYEIDENICANLSRIWELINSKRKIGPAIIEDLYKYSKSGNPADYSGGLIMYVLPQFEGLLEETQIEFIKKILELDFINNREELKNFASEFFGIDRRKFN